MKDPRIKALAEQAGISEDEVLDGLLGMQGIISGNPKLGRLLEIANNPDPDDDMKSELEMALGGYNNMLNSYNDVLNRQTKQYNKSLSDFDGVILALAQKLYPNATPEGIVENFKAVAPEGAESLSKFDAFMQALGMFEQGQAPEQGDVQAVQDEFADNANQAIEQPLEEPIAEEVTEEPNTVSLKELKLGKAEGVEPPKRLFGRDLIAETRKRIRNNM